MSFSAMFGVGGGVFLRPFLFLHRSFSTSMVIPMSILEVSNGVLCGCGASIRGTGTIPEILHASSARASDGVSGSILEVPGSGVDSA